MSKIQERIAKLLALADSPNEHEARAALLKARELMAEYKLWSEETEERKTAGALSEQEVYIFGFHDTKYGCRLFRFQPTNSSRR